MRYRMNMPKLMFDMFILLFPILPEFTHVLGRPVYEIVTLFTFGVYCIFQHRLKIKGIFGFLAAGVLLYAVCYGVHGEYTSVVTVIIYCFIPVLFVFSYIDSKKKVEESLDILLAGGLALCVSAVIEYISGFNVFGLIQTIDRSEDMGAWAQSYRDGVLRVEGPFGQPLPFAMYLVFLNFAAILRMRQGKLQNQRIRPLVKITYVLSILTLYLTTGRFALALLTVLQLFFIRTWSSAKKMFIFAAGVAAILCIILCNKDGSFDFLYAFLSLLDNRFYSFMEDGGQNIAYRLQLYVILIPYILERPFAGMGYALGSKLTFLMVTPTSTWKAYSIDNSYLCILVNYGIFGLIAFNYLLYTCIIKCVKSLKIANDHYSRWFLLCFVLYALNLFSVAQLGEKRIFFVLAGMYLAIQHRKIQIGQGGAPQ